MVGYAGSPCPEQPNGPVWSRDGWLALRRGCSAALTSDLDSWDVSPTSLGGFRLDVTYGAGKFVAAGRAENVAVSTDGMEWTTEALPEGTSLESNAYGNGVFVGAGVNARLVRSANAINWEIVKENNGHYIIKDTLSTTQRADIDDIQLTANLHSWTTEGVSLSDRHPVGNAQTFTARITGEAGTADERYIRIRWSLLQ